MLKRIESIKDFGVFSDWKADADLPDFAQYNLIYGANGSGKSTLGRLLDRLGGREFDPEHAQAQFAVVKEGGSRLTRDNPRVACPVHVFNKDFEKRNIDWDKRVESILLVSEERIADREELERLRAQHEGAFEELAATEGERDRIGRAVKKFWSDRASDMKKIFGALGTEEDRFLRYDAPKLERLFETAGRELTGGAAMLLSETLDRTRKAARAGEPKPSLAAPAYCLDPQEVDALARRVEDLLATSAEAKVVERLRERPEIARWVEDGLAFHDHVATQCEFCTSPLPAGRLDELQAHFSAAFNDLKQAVESARAGFAHKRAARPELPGPDALYPEFAADYLTRQTELDAAWSAYEAWLMACESALGAKLANPLDVSITPPALGGTVVEAVNRALESAGALIARHNEATREFAKRVREAMTALERHYASEFLHDGVQLANLAKVEELKKAAVDQNTAAQALRARVDTLEAGLSSPTLGAAEFNAKLHRFLGRDDLSLVFDPAQKGYRIERIEGRQAKHLSEGEKTAIAFVYFMTKLCEQGNRVEDTIVVLDDPISSFDSNHLFGAFSYIREHCQPAKQLFVLTHNFGFFCHVRRWMLAKNEEATDKRSAKARAACFFVKTHGGPPRAAALGPLPTELLEYDTEYHHLFARLWRLREAGRDTGSDAFDAANVARRLLETLIHFKFPKHRGDFRSGLMLTLGDDRSPAREQVRERIYRFTNSYSHSSGIPVEGGVRDNLLGESPDVVKLVLEVIEELDKSHYDGMVALVSGGAADTARAKKPKHTR